MKINALKRLVNSDWWDDFGPGEQDSYLKKHPGSPRIKKPHIQDTSIQPEVKLSDKEHKKAVSEIKAKISHLLGFIKRLTKDSEDFDIANELLAYYRKDLAKLLRKK